MGAANPGLAACHYLSEQNYFYSKKYISPFSGILITGMKPQSPENSGEKFSAV
jgi:hypothetical protein